MQTCPWRPCVGRHSKKRRPGKNLQVLFGVVFLAVKVSFFLLSLFEMNIIIPLAEKRRPLYCFKYAEDAVVCRELNQMAAFFQTSWMERRSNGITSSTKVIIGKITMFALPSQGRLRSSMHALRTFSVRRPLQQPFFDSIHLHGLCPC
jgi:hypothetical protein